MFCLTCQTYIQRKSLDDYFKRTTLCSKCQRLKHTFFEESFVPYHHMALTFKYSSILIDNIFFTHVMNEIIHTQGEYLSLTRAKDVDALMLALWMDESLYFNEYLRLENVEYIQALEAIPLVLITA